MKEDILSCLDDLESKNNVIRKDVVESLMKIYEKDNTSVDLNLLKLQIETCCVGEEKDTLIKLLKITY